MKRFSAWFWHKKYLRVVTYLAITFFLFLLAFVIAILHLVHPVNLDAASGIEVCQPNATQLLSLINQERSMIGAPILSVDPALATSAHNKLADEVTGQYYGHNKLDGSSEVSFIRSQGIQAAWSEDLDENTLTPSTDWNTLKNSSAHYASLTDPQYTRIGIAEQCVQYTTVQNTDGTGNVPIGTAIKELTVVHLAASEPLAQVQVPAQSQPTQVAPRQQTTTCYPAYFSTPARCITQ